MNPPTPENPTPPARGSRRDMLLGGLGGLAAGLVGGGAGGVMYGRRAAGLAGDDLSPPVRATRSLFDTYAQCGEDRILSWLLTATPLQLKTVSYLDIGTHDPIWSNNTYLFYAAGGRGVLMEPNPALADRIRSERPDDKLLTAGVGITDATEMDYYMFNDDQLNTFDKEYADRIVKDAGRKLEKVVKLPLININRVIAEHMSGTAPDCLSIDVEGLDLVILKTLDFDRYRPKVVCTETLKTTTFDHDPEIPKLMDAKGYELWGRTFANSIFMDRKVIPRK